MSSPIVVPRTIWSAELPETPVSKGHADELLFNLAPGIGPCGPTWVLACRYLVKSPILDYYGGQLPAPIRVVAVDTESGVVYSKQLTSAKSPPVFMLASDAPVAATGSRSQGARFNVDLPALLDLPPEAACYSVFLWLDLLVSPMSMVELEANPLRRSRPTSSEMSGRPLLVSHVSGLRAPGDGLVLNVNPKSESIEGDWDTNKTGLHYPLAVLAYGQRDRRFIWTGGRFDTSAEAPRANHFEFARRALPATTNEGVRQKVFVVVVAGKLRSEVLAL